jgi:hypothetical protein
MHDQAGDDAGESPQHVIERDELSGRMIRSTDECEMSRSCQRAKFSKAA